MRRRLMLVLALAALSARGDANAIRRSSSFVAPTRGSAHSLTLTTYVTDAADLHYATVLAGHAPLEAAVIKSAAQQCADEATEAEQDDRSRGVVQASTKAVHRAQKLEQLLDGLKANTSYDVYFVTEVPNSNGVFGQVLSVLGATTHPTAPTMQVSSVQAANASATSIVVNLTLSSPGIVRFAFVPSARDELTSFTAEDVVAHNTRGVPAVFVTEPRFGWDSLSMSSVIEDLTPATEYDVLMVTEALGNGDVFSQLSRHERAVQTHAAPPDVVGVMCSPVKASASQVDVSLRLQFTQEDLRRATPVTVDRYRYRLHYDVFSKTENGTAINSQQGILPISMLERDLLQSGGGDDRTYSIGDLDSGTDHDIDLRVETVDSHGVFGQPRRIEGCRTHANAPKIIKANAQAMNGTVHALQVEIELERPGNVHYVLTPRSASSALRTSFQRARNTQDIAQVLKESADGQGARTGVVEMTERDSASTVSEVFLIDGLEDNSQYSIAVMSETIGSFGVFGVPFDTLLEATTHENASEISVISAEPTQGSVTSVDIQVSMTKPTDLLFACWNRHQQEPDCYEVPKDDFQRTSQSPQVSGFVYRVGNLTEDTEYEVVLYTESHLRNGVRSAATDMKSVRTHRKAPELLSIKARAVDARVDALRLHIETSESGRVHFAVVTDMNERSHHDAYKVNAVPLPAASIISDDSFRDFMANHRSDFSDHTMRNSQDISDEASSVTRPQPMWSVVKRDEALIRGRSLDLLIADLESNCTYFIHVVTETAHNDDDSSTSGVYGSSAQVSATTHDVAPSIVKATADAVSNQTDSIVITVNVSRPGIVHYFVTDTDFADPATIKHGQIGSEVQPHTLRGSFVVEDRHMAFEIKNGTNDTQPMEPLVFARNFTVENLRKATTYHLSLTTETLGSHGLFGEFPAPILVTTHDAPPQFVPDSLYVGPTAGSSTSMSIQFHLDKLGDVHYAIFFRGLVRDRTTDAVEVEEQRRLDEQELAAQAHAEANKHKDNKTKTVEFVKIPRWPPPSSLYDLSRLTPRSVKDALFEELNEGVWENGTISVSRDDVVKMKLAEKKLEKLPPNAIFDVCLVPETAASDGIFASLTCSRVVTHADYSNQSRAFDEVHVTPVAGTKDSVHIKLAISKKLGVSDLDTTVATHNLSHLERVAGRVPYFVLIDGQEGRSEFAHNNIARPSRHNDRSISPFKTAVPGRGNVVAAGILDFVTSENDSFVIVERTVTGLHDNHRYFFFFAYETAGSDGVFTTVNPHKHAPNETNSRHSGVPAIEVTTFQQAPHVKRYEAMPTYGSTNSITVMLDIACASREEVILHLIVMNENCPVLPTSVLLAGAGELSTVETSGLPSSTLCDYPLIYRRVEVNMTERSNDNRHQQDHRHSRHSHSSNQRSHSIEEEILGANILQQNTTYQVLIATETYNSSGVVSEKFEIVHVTTSPIAPRFKKLSVQPRKGSTTELLIVLELNQPGEVHYMLGKSGNPDLNVTSPYNVSAKSLPGHRDSKFHDYEKEVVRSRRTIKVEDARQTHVEVVDYLVAGTSYDVYVVAETADDSGIYGEVVSFMDVATFSTPPMLLAHTAYPTPQRTDSLSVGFRVEDGVPCFVHISVIASSPREMTAQVAPGSDTFGNRLALEDRFIGRSSILVDGANSGEDDGWHEVNVSVPRPGTNYTVFLVTETKDSDGVFGTVASHQSVRSHREPPVPLNVSVRPTDARVDAVTVDIGLSHDEGGHIHFAVLRHRQRFSRTAITKVGRIDVNGSNTSSFIIDGLQGRTTYDVYLRLETLESGGVISEWTPFPVTATTHGLPAEVLESVECEVSPTCDLIGRQPCSHIANVCGDCLDGYDGETGSSNVPCRPFESEQARPSIKISGVRINPRRRRPHQLETQEESEPEPNPLFEDAEVPTHASNERAPAAVDADQPDDTEVDQADDMHVPPSCPFGANLLASGKCECDVGYHLDNLGTSCVPSLENPLRAQSMAVNYASRAL